jgi:glycosyltransferase involved in cell wall biosynthesis
MMMSSKPDACSIFLLVRSLGTGGAERQLVQLALGLKERGYVVRVGVFYNEGPLLPDLESGEISVVDLGKKGRWDLLGFLFRVKHAIADAEPEIVYSFLGGANLIAVAALMLGRKFKLVWSIRASDMDLNQYEWTRRFSYRAECLFSDKVDLIIANSFAGRTHAISKGFSPRRLAVVPNGIDTKRFHPDPLLRHRQRQQWGLSDKDVAIGVLARLDPMKGHRTFLKAAARIAQELPNCRFLCIGEGSEKAQLQRFAHNLDISDRVKFLGQTDDPVAALNGLDIYCSSSDYGEGFSNSVGEAMACAIPCVVTNVGDSARIVGDTGIVVPRADPAALAEALVLVASQRGLHNGFAARQRILENYDTRQMVERTAELLLSTLRQ